ncbi:uncharacterized protein N0V89_010816 [Didymosphaeria variabile]|uniref:Heme haloperoxidase family profile domain-containing protein n=1 Tax=Didymosphaeria variabile TaxID=1932322 RepID=A0A9W9C6Y0_9PLEO|nr:uncharacterized protein N0V89_010816 [Didymosphaeria variabile]KAJ4346883.1 hypothetical protein N0V89_010816 [Didymosphaeria variabile]
MGLIRKLSKPLILIFVVTWDFGLFLLNVILPARKPGHVVPAGAPGHALNWPAYEPPKPTDSRSSCKRYRPAFTHEARWLTRFAILGPMLNALANHNILPHSGRDISFRTLNTTVRQCFNFAPSFCFFVPHFAADFLDRSYWRDSFNLEELSKHNAIEHDASLTRRDAALEPNQSKPDIQLVEQLLASATGGTPEARLLTKKDLSAMLSRRRVESRKENEAYSESRFHNGFGSANSSTMLTIFGGRINDLRPMLLEERFAEDWEPRIRSHFGLTMAAFNGTVLPVERGVNTKAYVRSMESEGVAPTGMAQ